MRGLLRTHTHTQTHFSTYYISLQRSRRSLCFTRGELSETRSGASSSCGHLAENYIFPLNIVGSLPHSKECGISRVTQNHNPQINTINHCQNPATFSPFRRSKCPSRSRVQSTIIRKFQLFIDCLAADNHKNNKTAKFDFYWCHSIRQSWCGGRPIYRFYLFIRICEAGEMTSSCPSHNELFDGT